MTPQEVFDLVVTHLRNQGHKAETTISYEDPLRKGIPQCVYLDPETGDRCSAGCLIEREEYSPQFEGKSFVSIINQPIYGAPIGMVERLSPHVRLIEALQHVHDREDVSDWEEYLVGLANRFGLQYNPPPATT